jgi:hypothetical protein
MAASNPRDRLPAELAQQQNGSGQGQAENQATQDDQSSAANNEAAPALIADTTTVQTVSADPSSNRKEQREQADLRAQQDMALYALLMFIASAATVIITAVGVWLVKRTLDATLKAVEDTSEATEAMREANQIAEIATRPWLTLEMEHGFSSGHTDGEKILFFANLQIANIGGTPAQNVSVETADVPDVIRNEFGDLFAISENLSDQFSDLEHMVVFPSSTETFQAIFSTPFTETGAGTVAFPDILIVVNYRLGNGSAAQTSARFISTHGNGEREVFRGERLPEDFDFERAGYIRVT